MKEMGYINVTRLWARRRKWDWGWGETYIYIYIVMHTKIKYNSCFDSMASKGKVAVSKGIRASNVLHPFQLFL